MSDDDKKLLTMVESIGLQLEPDEDWIPVLLGLKNGERALCTIDPLFLDDGNGKDRLFYGVLPQLILKEKFHEVAIVMTCWMLRLDGQKAGEVDVDNLPIPSQSPDRIEAVVVTVMDSENVKAYIAKITRLEKRAPTLDKWEECPGVEGRISDVILPMLRYVRYPTAPMAAVVATAIAKSRGSDKVFTEEDMPGEFGI